MTGKIGLALFIPLLALSFCSKSKANAPAATAQPAAQPQAGMTATGETPLQVKAVSLLPDAPTILDDVTAVPVLADPKLENVDFQYQWFVNGQENQEVDGEKLGKAHLKNGAWLYCLVKAESGKGESAWCKSDVIRVQNSLPTLNLVPVGNFSVPGVFQYQAGASDPDGDILTYELLSPLDQGILLDPQSGALTWKIDAETVKRLGQKIEIKLAVSDGDGGKTSGSITLNLTKPK